MSLLWSFFDFCLPLRLLFLGLCLALPAWACISSELVSDLWQSDRSGMLDTSWPPEALRCFLDCFMGRVGGCCCCCCCCCWS